MEKEFVTYPIGLRLKALGFDEPCFGYYVDGELRGINLGIEELGGIEPYYQRFGFHTLSNHDIDNPNKIVVTAPTYSQAFRWFREKYNAVCEIIRKEDGNHSEFIGWVFINNRKIDVVSYWDSKTYEEAELACLNKLLEIVESKSE